MSEWPRADEYELILAAHVAVEYQSCEMLFVAQRHPIRKNGLTILDHVIGTEAQRYSKATSILNGNSSRRLVSVRIQGGRAGHDCSGTRAQRERQHSVFCGVLYCGKDWAASLQKRCEQRALSRRRNSLLGPRNPFQLARNEFSIRRKFMLTCMCHGERVCAESLALAGQELVDQRV